MSLPYAQYCSGAYLARNPTWDAEDSPWKAAQVRRMLSAHNVRPCNIVEVGCGAGGVLAALRESFPEATLVGYEIAADAARFWGAHEKTGVRYVVGDFLESNAPRFDLLLLLDVLEHLPNPFEFLQRLSGRAEHYVFHIPLDLSALSVLREKPLLDARRRVGHIHYFTKELALSLLEECGFRVMGWFFTEAWRTGPRHGLKTSMAAFPRLLFGLLSRELGARLVGGETLIVLARTDGQ